MHTKFIYLTYYVWRQVQRARTRCWLEWAPHSASTISVLNMTYSTPVPLVREGQGVSLFFAYPFSFLVPLAQLKHHPETTLKHWVWLLNPLDQKLPTLFSWPQAVPAPLFTIQILFQLPYFFLHIILLVLQVQYPITHSVPLLFSILCLLDQVDKLLMQLLGFGHQLLHLCREGSDDGFWDRSTKDGRGRGLPRLQEGDWHQNRSSPKLGQEFLFPELVLPPLAGALVLETPIEFHCDSKHISAFYGGYFIGL